MVRGGCSGRAAPQRPGGTALRARGRSPATAPSAEDDRGPLGERCGRRCAGRRRGRRARWHRAVVVAHVQRKAPVVPGSGGPRLVGRRVWGGRRRGGPRCCGSAGPVAARARAGALRRRIGSRHWGARTRGAARAARQPPRPATPDRRRPRRWPRAWSSSRPRLRVGNSPTARWRHRGADRWQTTRGRGRRGRRLRRGCGLPRGRRPPAGRRAHPPDRAVVPGLAARPGTAGAAHRRAGFRPRGPDAARRPRGRHFWRGARLGAHPPVAPVDPPLKSAVAHRTLMAR